MRFFFLFSNSKVKYIEYRGKFSPKVRWTLTKFGKFEKAWPLFVYFLDKTDKIEGRREGREGPEGSEGSNLMFTTDEHEEH